MTKIHYPKKFGAFPSGTACGKGTASSTVDSLDATTCKRCRKSTDWKHHRAMKVVSAPYGGGGLDPKYVRFIKDTTKVVHALDRSKVGVRHTACGTTVPLDDFKVAFRSEGALEVITCPACYKGLATELADGEKRMAERAKMTAASAKKRMEMHRTRR